MSNACQLQIEEVLGRSMTTGEQQRIEDMMGRMLLKGKDVNWNQAALEAALDKNLDDLLVESLAKARNTYLNRRAVGKMTDWVNKYYPEKPWEGIEAALVGKQGTNFGTRNNLALSASSLNDQLIQMLLVNLEKIDPGLRKELSSGRYDTDIRSALYKLDRGEDLAGVDPVVVKVAQHIRDHTENIRMRANFAGAQIRKRDGWAGTQSHDMYKISRAGYDTWKEHILGEQGLDLDATFGTITADDLEQSLKRLYNQFSTGQHLKADTEGTGGLTGMQNIGRSMSHRRKLVFKSAEAETAYNQKFGGGTLIESISRTTETMAQNIAIMERMGPNADMNFNEVLNRIGLRLQDGDQQAFATWREKSHFMKDVLWGTVTGAAQIPGNAMWARRWSIVRGVKSMASLGMSVLSALSDVPIAAAAHRYQGGGMLSGMGKQTAAIFKGLNKVDRLEAHAAMGTALDGIKGAYTDRLDPDGGMPGVMTRMMNRYFRWNMLTPWTDRQMAEMAVSTSAGLATHVSRAYGELPAEWQRILHASGIDDVAWDAVRGSQTRMVDAYPILTAEDVGRVSDDAVKPILTKKGLSHTTRNIREAKTDLGNTFRVMLQDQAQGGVVMPGAKARATLLRGTRPGTATGEVARMIGQFKMFPVGVLQGPIARELYGYGNKSDAIKGLANLMISTAAGGYLAMNLKELAKGREPRLPSEDSWMQVLLASMTQGGGLGIYGDFLFGDMKNRFGGGPIETLAGPVAGVFADVVDLYQRARDGDPVAANAARIVVNNTPFVSLFYTKAILDYTLFYQMQEALSPGYLKRMERRMKKEYDQGFIYSPSEAVR